MPANRHLLEQVAAQVVPTGATATHLGTGDANNFDDCMATLGGLGYRVETDWRPLRVEVVAGGERWVDVHPVTFDASGHGVQGDPVGTHFRYPPDAFAQGRIGNRAVPCLSVSQQLAFHSGYELRPQDEHDLGELRRLQARESAKPLA